MKGNRTIVVLAVMILAALGFAGCHNPSNSEVKKALAGTVAITGTPNVGETLTADITGITNAKGKAAYQWKRDGADIGNATEATYVLVDADGNKAITVTVSFSGNTGSLTSGQTENVRDVLKGIVGITGAAKVEAALAADITGITNGAGNVSYQWKRDGADIAGATGSAYTPGSGDANKKITVTVVFSGNFGNLTSAPTENVKMYYAILAGKFKVYQGEGVTDEQMAASYATWQEAYASYVNTYNMIHGGGGGDAVDGKISEIYIIADENYTWDNINKILGVKQGLRRDIYVIRLDRIENGTLIPTVTQTLNTAKETVRMAHVPQEGPDIAQIVRQEKKKRRAPFLILFV
jgi:hypothetical protein